MVKIIIKDNIITPDAARNIITTFYIDVNGECFPDDQWDDFVGTILGMWIENLLKYKHANRKKFILYFMDGPFLMEVFKKKDELTIDCISDRGVRTKICSFTCTYQELVFYILEALKDFNAILFEKGLNEEVFANAYDLNVFLMGRIRLAL